MGEVKEPDYKKIILLIIALLILCVITSFFMGRKRASENTAETQVEETTDINNNTSDPIIINDDDSSTDVKTDEFGNIIEESTDSAFNDNGSTYTENQETVGSESKEEYNAEDSKVAVDETEATQEEEYKEVHDPDKSYREIVDDERKKEFDSKNPITNKSISTETQDDSKVYFNNDNIEGNMDFREVGVDINNGTTDCSVGFDVYDMLRGEEADKFITEYNNSHNLKYNVEHKSNYENLVIPYKIKYGTPLNSEDSKLEPEIIIGEELTDYIEFNGEQVRPQVSIVYTEKTTSGRSGYLITTLPKDKYTEYCIKIRGYDKGITQTISLDYRK